MIILILLVVACTPEADPHPWPAGVAVSYGLAPEPSLFGWTLKSIGRWNQARGCYPGSGCELHLDDDGGVPVMYVPEIVQLGEDLHPIIDETGDVLTASGCAHKSPGEAYVPGGPWASIQIAESVDDVEKVLMHELAHVLGLVNHTKTGVSLYYGGALTRAKAVELEYWTISEETLSVVCSATLCLEFNPEEPFE